MNTVSSSQFRVNYTLLSEPTAVYSGRRHLGTWYPATTEAPVTLDAAPRPVPLPPGPPVLVATPKPETPRERQRRIDDILRKSNG